jgi:hypothetical protein
MVHVERQSGFLLGDSTGNAPGSFSCQRGVDGSDHGVRPHQPFGEPIVPCTSSQMSVTIDSEPEWSQDTPLDALQGLGFDIGHLELRICCAG